MSTYTVTSEKGGKTRPLLMTVAPPANTMTRDDLSPFAQGAGVNGAFFADLLSSFLAHERCGVHLYRAVAGMTLNEEWRAKFEEFGKETEDHVRILENLVTELGGDPMYVSPSARLTEFQNTKLLEAPLIAGSLDAATMELAGLEAVLLAERKCHANWQLLSAIVGDLADPDVKRAVENAVAKVEDQEDEHVAWAESTWQATLVTQLQLV